MELRHLRYFLAVAKQGSIRQAAAQLCITQPAVSKQIKELEGELRLSLFERTAGGMVLTAAGRYYQQQCTAILAELDSVNSHLQQLANGVVGSLALGFVDVTAWQGAVPEALQRFSQHHPDVALTLQSNNTPELLGKLQERQLDGAFVYCFAALPETLASVTLSQDELLLAYPTSWPQPPKPGMTITQLNTLPFISFPRNAYPAYHDWLLQAYTQLGLNPTLRQLAQTENAMLSLVSAGVGVAIVNARHKARPTPGVGYTSLDALKLTLPLSFVYPRGAANPALPLFISELKSDN
ncbi:LysR family transcriptional regulator [Gallaecimonas sp. GXIMD1310]|uniref:LysR family transcriptional regulator n=1 Tax=Gallaecimonas sp. GXIMD1310 TaxID=3131926 RepID=UPI0032435F8B